MNYFYWHYLYVWPQLFVVLKNLFLFPIYLFSVPLHLRTLLSLWHRQYVEKGRGFDLSNVVSVVIFNVFSRIIGFVIRVFTISAGIFFSIVCLVIGLFLVVTWPFLPVLTLPFYLTRRRSSEELAQSLVHRHKNQLKDLVIDALSTPNAQFTFKRLNLEIKQFAVDLKKDTDVSHFNHFSQMLQSNRINYKISDLLFSASHTFTPLRELLAKKSVSPSDVLETSSWYEKLYDTQEPPLLLSTHKIKSLRGIGVEWAYGYTIRLDKFAKDMTNDVTAYPLLVGRDNELLKIQKVLLKTEAKNVLLVGEPGVARHQIVETLAHQIASGNCLQELLHKRVLKLDSSALIATKPTILETKGLVSSIFDEATFAGNVIMFIDEIHKYLTEGEGNINLSEIFSRLSSSSISIIGITDPASFHRFIEPNSAVMNVFEKIDILPVSERVLLNELELSIVPQIEKKTRTTITYPAIKRTIEDAQKYLSSSPIPAKSIEVLEGACLYVSTNKSKNILLSEDVDSYLSDKTHQKIGTINENEKNILNNLEDLIHKRVINQETAISQIASSLRRARLQISDRNKPIGSFLFLGPTGVGKTETAKALSQYYFGSVDSMIRFDMSQYQLLEGLERLIGSVKLGTPGELTSKLRDNPFCVVLLDEFEKADKQIYNLFLTLLDEGYITDHTGKKVNAKNCIVIATSNAGSEFIREETRKGISSGELSRSLIDHVQSEKIYSPEFLNRFDSVVVFTPLSEGHLREITKLQLLALNKRLEDKNIRVKITPELVNQLVALGFDPQFGARSIKRKIAETIEDIVAKKLMDGSAKQGEEIEIDLW